MTAPRDAEVDRGAQIESGYISSLNRLLKTFQVETVGDLYMVASGIPTRNDSHAAEIADMALNLVPIISRKDFLPGKTSFELFIRCECE